MTQGIKGTGTIINCSVCNKEFKIRPYSLKATKQPCCSRACAAIAHRKQKAEVHCVSCGKPVKISQISKRLNNPKGVYCSRQCWGDQRAFLTPKAQYPSRANKKAHLARVRGKACLICGFDRIIDWCHIIPRKIGGTAHYINMIPLCPNHHRLFDRHTLTEGEWDKISDALLDSWGDPLAAHLPGDDYLFSEEGQRQLNAIPLESLLNLPDGATWDSLIERPFPTSLQESSPLQAHEGNDEEPQGA